MPYEWIYSLFGQKNALSVLWVTLGSVPMFLHQISASSILYHIKSSLSGTLDGAAGLAFMIGGPVTAVPTMIMFWTIFKKRVFFLYMFICLVGTITISYAFQLLVFVPYADTGNPLLKEVGSISGGSGCIINKQNKQVRIVMDPGNKGMIATYQNGLAGQGAVVFDAGFWRFLNYSADRYDNLKYINNIAQWLEENSSSSANKSILIYDTFAEAGLDKQAFSNNALVLLSKKGFRVRVTDRLETPEISERLLEDFSQCWIFNGESGQGHDITAAELDVLSRFSDGGKGMLIVAGKHQDGPNDLAAVNRLSSRYGVVFSGFVENKDELPASTASQFFNRTSEALGRILKLVHKA
ncbi:MAG: hypothetical protein WAV13_06840, partial [Thermodesulfovibrionales bacterium]